MRSRIVVAILIIGAVFWIGLSFIKQRVGDIRPAIFPSAQNITNIIENNQRVSPKPSETVTTKVGDNPQFPLKLPAGFRIGIFAKNLGKPRDLEFSPAGTLLASIPEQGKVFVLPDSNNDGQADEVKTLLSGLNKPHGLAFYPFDSAQGRQDKLFVAELTRVVRYTWNETNLTATQDKVLFSLPPSLGGHNTRSLVFNRKGQLFVTIGSTCNVCRELNDWYAAVIVSDADGNNPRVFAKGLRNSVFLTVNPKTNEVWAGDMGRDYLGDNLPPEEINILRDGRDYGWPICYGNKIHDSNFDPSPPAGRSGQACANTEAPIFEYQAHSAPLGLTFINSPQFPADWQGDLLISYHGSWNRSVPTGYKIVHLKVNENTITGAEDFLTGFLPARNVTHSVAGEQGSEALGRPVDVIFDIAGSLYISDDKAGAVYKVIRG